MKVQKVAKSSKIMHLAHTLRSRNVQSDAESCISVCEKCMKPTSKNLKTLPVGIHNLERGVYLRVTTSGKRGWIFKYQLHGRRREMGLGGVDQPITAVQAKAAQARALLVDGIDPMEEKRAAKAEAKSAAMKARCPTFAEFVEPTLEHVGFVRQFTGAHTAASWRCTLEAVAKSLGSMRLNEITKDDIAAVYRPVWTEHPRTARDYMNRVNALFEFAMAKGYIEKNPAQWKGNLDSLLPSLSVVRRSKPEEHHAAVSPERLQEIAGWLRERVETSPTARLLLVVMLTACRLSEIRLAEWTEVDDKAATIAVPQSRRKDRKPEPFIVPLSRQALALVRGAPQTGGKYVFEGRSHNSKISHATPVRYLQTQFEDEITVHGFRSTFSDWCAQNDKPFIVSEKCLMHAVGGKVFMAYQRDDLLEKRRKLLQEWADFLLG